MKLVYSHHMRVRYKQRIGKDPDLKRLDWLLRNKGTWFRNGETNQYCCSLSNLYIFMARRDGDMTLTTVYPHTQKQKWRFTKMDKVTLTFEEMKE